MIAFLTRPMNRGSYAAVGFGLMLFKYFVEAVLIRSSGGGFYSPAAFLLPLISSKSAALDGTSSFLWMFLVTWSLPFVFIALVFSIRRCVDAGLSPWFGFWVLCPLVNLFVMLSLCFLPTHLKQEAPAPDSMASHARNVSFDALSAVIVGLAIGAGMLLLGVYILRDYSVALFYVSPIVMGAISSYRFSRSQSVTVGGAIGVAILCVSLALVMMLLFALEGVVCVAMAAPLVFGAGGIGGVLGYAIAQSSSIYKQNWGPAVVLLPTMSLLESFVGIPPDLCKVTSVVEIDAPCQQVWNEVVAFTPITAPPSGWFRWGIAYPVRARIEGQGVGAVRYCEFSTGDFEEPITVWNEPHHLAFDVSKQPSPLTELSPYQHVHAPHLDGFLSSRRGEFRLIELPGNRTRLEGRTWYTNDMFPQLYWRIWSEQIIHAIHLRVLEHIRDQAQKKK